ncbi:type VI secretion system-associated protein [Photobacterium aquae]|uniref:Type VI secretion system-associated protein n=1 Tax=Photobacterium aquae TaxID=1195763 RepID=A0A0J1JNB1_9GAMM|nr:type VI secretion system-associated protein TagF [Photobacterium aquae]KLV03732.1 type VI secretion system-associated protein [Photobacterium aquae]
MPNDIVAAQFGYFGKVPVRGDFIQDHLPLDFLDPWNEWLQAVQAVSREQLGEQWLECYLTSPVWHFSLSPGVCGDSGMVGTLMPSIDNVGRHYYFTLATSVENPPVAYWQSRQWSENAEDLVLQLLDDDMDLIQWLENLKNTDLLSDLVNNPNSAVKTEAGMGNQIVLLGEEHVQACDLLHLAYKTQFDRYCIWWTAGSERMKSATLVTSGLPLISQFAAMLDGNWEQWGW